MTFATTLEAIKAALAESAGNAAKKATLTDDEKRLLSEDISSQSGVTDEELKGSTVPVVRLDETERAERAWLHVLKATMEKKDRPIRVHLAALIIRFPAVRWGVDSKITAGQKAAMSRLPGGNDLYSALNEAIEESGVKVSGRALMRMFQKQFAKVAAKIGELGHGQYDATSAEVVSACLGRKIGPITEIGKDRVLQVAGSLATTLYIASVSKSTKLVDLDEQLGFAAYAWGETELREAIRDHADARALILNAYARARAAQKVDLNKQASFLDVLAPTVEEFHAANLVAQTKAGRNANTFRLATAAKVDSKHEARYKLTMAMAKAGMEYTTNSAREVIEFAGKNKVSYEDAAAKVQEQHTLTGGGASGGDASDDDSIL